jgi:signal transduction histidine kinase
MADGNGRAHQAQALLPARLHDISAGLAVGLGLLKSMDGDGAGSTVTVAVKILDSVLHDLKSITRMGGYEGGAHPEIDLAGELREEARRVGIELELEVAGGEKWLTAEELELIRLAGREAIRNVRRHSGTFRCRITVDLSDCPFVLRARDWGAGINSAAQHGEGIQTLRELASRLGGEVAVGSQPGQGTVFVLAGRRCPYRGQPRSVVAEESLSSRRRVAPRRPSPACDQQVTKT